MKTYKTIISICFALLFAVPAFAQKDKAGDITFVCDKVSFRNLEYDYEEMGWRVADSSETTGKFLIKLTNNRKNYEGATGEVVCENVDCTFDGNGGYCRCSSGDEGEYYVKWFSIDLENKTISEGFESTSFASNSEYRIVEIIGNW